MLCNHPNLWCYLCPERNTCWVDPNKLDFPCGYSEAEQIAHINKRLKEIEANIDDFARLSGANFTGEVTAKEPVNNSDVATKYYVDTHGGGGGGDVTLSGNNTFTGKNTFVLPISIADGVEAGNAATLKQVTDKYNEIISKINAIRQVPSGGGKSQVLTANGDGTYSWLFNPNGDVKASADNTFTGKNKFTQAVSIPKAVKSEDAIQLSQLDSAKTELNAAISAVKAVPAGGKANDVLTADGTGSYSWKPAQGGGGGGDVTLAGDNAFTGSNSFTKPIVIGTGSAVNNAATVKQVNDAKTELNSAISEVKAVPAGGTVGQVLTSKGNDTYEWEDPKAVGDVTLAGNNTFTGKNKFTQSVGVADGVEVTDAATVKQVNDAKTELNSAISAVKAVPAGGNAGQVLTSKGNNSYEWKDPKTVGDVTLAGNNTFTGKNKFNQSVGVADGVEVTDAATVKQVNDARTELNSAISAVKAVPEGGKANDVLTSDGAGSYSWKPAQGGGGGDVTLAGDNAFTGSNSFTKPIVIGTGSAVNNAATVKQVNDAKTELNSAISEVKAVPAGGNANDVLTADGSGAYSWKPAQGGGGGGLPTPSSEGKFLISTPKAEDPNQFEFRIGEIRQGFYNSGNEIRGFSYSSFVFLSMPNESSSGIKIEFVNPDYNVFGFWSVCKTIEYSVGTNHKTIGVISNNASVYVKPNGKAGQESTSSVEVKFKNTRMNPYKYIGIKIRYAGTETTEDGPAGIYNGDLIIKTGGGNVLTYKRLMINMNEYGIYYLDNIDGTPYKNTILTSYTNLSVVINASNPIISV